MEADEDMIVLVVVDDEDEKSTNTQSEVKIKTEPEIVNPVEGSLQVDDLLDTAERHGEYIPVKIETPDYSEYDYLEDELLQQVLNTQVNRDDIQDFDNSPDYSPEDEADIPDYGYTQDSDKHRFTMLKPWQQRSFVAELRQEYPELKEDEELLVSTLEQIMRCAKPPPPPRDYYIMTGIMFECIQCGTLSESIPAASRHYQEKHGQRYLVCYACGVDFRSATNLYKHEKRCVAPDANLVLQARAAFLGRKGRSRPYLKQHPFSTKKEKVTFPCQLCSAVFRTRHNLRSHENLHRGERPYRCHACVCAYTSPSALARHSMKHTNIQFICDHCDRSFKVKAALVSHMDTHKSSRRFPCGECGRAFARRYALALHVRRLHRRLPPPCACQLCPKRYPRMSLLKAHMKREHGMSIITRKMFLKSLPTMTELEIQQCKIVMKSDLNLTNFEYDAREETFAPKVARDIEYINVEESNVHNNYEELQEDIKPSIDELECETRNNSSEGSNVVYSYIHNGEVVQGLVVNQSQENLVLQLEAMVDGESLLATIKTEEEADSVRTIVRSDIL